MSGHACSDVENKLNIDNTLKNLVVELDPIINILEKYVSQYKEKNCQTEEVGTKEVDISLYKNELSQLKKLLEYDDTDAIPYTEQLIKNLASTKYNTILSEIKQAVDNYDFDAAIELYDKLMQV